MQVGVIGTGSFGMAITRLLAINAEVLIYSRKPEVAEEINTRQAFKGVALGENIHATNDIASFTEACTLIFPIISSEGFRDAMRSFSPYLRPYHLLIHGTKGFDVHGDNPNNRVHSMSEVIQQETNVARIGCLAGPNLATEIIEGQPTATVISSPFNEVIAAGKKVLSSKDFHVFSSYDMRGAEIAGALKNIVAIGSGMLKGLGLGKNIQAVYINQGLKEMIQFGTTVGAKQEIFLEVAGIGDLIATTTSSKSRNYTFGFRLGQGESYDTILADTQEVPEGIRTLKICQELAQVRGLNFPLIQTLYGILFQQTEKRQLIDVILGQN